MKPCLHKQVESRIPRSRLNRLFETVVDGEGFASKTGTVNLVFTTDRQMRLLNSRYRSINRPTDVLAFNIDEPSDDEDVYGEVYISVATAGRQAKEYGQSLTAELLRLACHGLLHLFGYDHTTREEAVKMHGRETGYLKRVGVNNDD